MHWTSDDRDRTFRLVDDDIDLARIHLSEKPGTARPFRVKVLVSFLYFGRITQRRLEKARKEWKVRRRDFPTEERALRYVERQKQDVLAFIRRREEA